MNFYIFFFVLLSLVNISNFKIDYKIKQIGLSILFTYLLIFIGLRHQVGGDWATYQNDFFKYISEFNLYDFSYKRDFGYEFISYIAYNLNFSIHIVNLLCSFIFLYAIFSLGKDYKNYILIILISFPNIIIVGAMGYTKQSTAFAFIILAFLSLKKDFNNKFLIYSVFAILFHKSAILIIALLFLSKFKIKIKYLVGLILLLIMSYFILLSDISRVYAYLRPSNMYSEGVHIRILINLIPAFIFMYFLKKLNFNLFEKNFIFFNIFLTFICIFISFEYSTFADRFLFYFAILQILVLPKFVELNNNSLKLRLIIIAFYFSLLLGWLVFANHSIQWTPYQNIIFVNE